MFGAFKQAILQQMQNNCLACRLYNMQMLMTSMAVLTLETCVKMMRMMISRLLALVQLPGNGLNPCSDASWLHVYTLIIMSIIFFPLGPLSSALQSSYSDFRQQFAAGFSVQSRTFQDVVHGKEVSTLHVQSLQASRDCLL